MEGPASLAQRLIAGARDGEVGMTKDILHPDVTWHASIGGLEPQTLYGSDSVRRAFDEYHRSWERHTFGEEALVESGDTVLMVVRELARGRGSGLEVEQGTAVLVTTSDGLITTIVTYLDVPQAYADFGLDPAAAAELEPGRTYELRDGGLVERGG
jgi:ketosteroid isomerase-like protein